MPATSTINLSTLNGSTGVRFDGATASDLTGLAVSGAGDVNGDGFDDIIIGAQGFNGTAGASYVVFGKAGGWASSIAVSALDGTSGFRVIGGASDGVQGLSVASAGDINGDGFADLIIGAPGPGTGTSAGASYVLFGKAAGFAPTLDVSTLNGANGFSIANVSAGDQLGFTVASAGDVNGDGLSDLIIGAPSADPNGQDAAGSTYVVFGKTGAWTPSLALAGLNGGNGFRLDGLSATDTSGVSVASAGDFNGDGFADLVIGAPHNDQGGANAGAIYVVYGSSGGFASSLNLSSISGTAGFRMLGASAGDNFGSMVSSAGDVNGDGLDDLIVAANFATVGNVANSGAAYVIFGTTFAFPGPLSANGAGFRIEGGTGLTVDVNQAALKVSAAGDLNGDGFDDVILGRPFADPSGLVNAGSSYVIYGKSGGFAAINLDTLDGTNGQRLDGVFGAVGNGDRSGVAVAAAGDVNGDGQPDIIIGADGADPGGKLTAGSAYLVFGNALTTTAALQLHGTVGNDAINGGGGNDTLDGRFGDDLLGGNAGNDLLLGGAGNDTLNGGAGNDTLDGGPGIDRLNYSAAAAGVTVSLAITTPQVILGQGSDTIRNVEELVGSAFNDSLTGSAGDNLINGLAGNDTINGGAGNDNIIAGDGNSTFDGGPGIDTLRFATASAGVNISLALTTPQVTGGSGTDTVLNIENLIGSGFNDTLTGSAGDNFISGNAGDDLIDGGAGNDTIIGGEGTDTLDGGAGIDTLSIQGAVNINLSILTLQNINALQSNVIRNFEILITGDGFDSLIGSAGADTISGGGGNDTIDGGPGDDFLDGGAGIDTLTYATAAAGISLNLGVTTPQATGGAGTDSVSNFEALIGSGFNDTFWSSAISPTINGGAGDDIFYGNGNAGSFIGGLGNDQFVVDKLGTILTENANEGIDTAWVAVNGFTVGANIEITRLSGGASIVTGSGSDEQLVANAGLASSIDGGAGADVLWGSALDNTLNGGAGDDIIRAQGGAGTFIGGLGNDQFVVDKLGTILLENVGEGTDTAWVTVNGYTIGANIEITRLAGTAANVTGSGSSEQIVANPLFGSTLNGGAGDDVLWGSGFADSLIGGAGDDIFRGQGGADTMVGGVGNDQYVVLNAGVVIVENADEGIDTIWYAVSGQTMAANTEWANLSGTAVSVTGNAGNNQIVGNPGLGNTLLAGGAGNDTIYGGTGADIFRGDAGNDIMTSGGGADRFLYQGAGWGQDQIAGFVQGQAKLDFTGSGISFSQLQLVASGANTGVLFGADNILVFNVVLTQSDFIFG